MRKRISWVLLFVCGWGVAFEKISFGRPRAETQLTWFGHSAFQIQTPQGRVLLIDPWLTNPLNPDVKQGKDPVASFSRVDYILVTHGHYDHVGEAVALGKKWGSRLVTSVELGDAMVKVLEFPGDQLSYDTLLQPGGKISLPSATGEVQIIATPAIHGSGISYADTHRKENPLVYGGVAMGFVIKIQNGPTFYHSGDTAYFSDMSLIGKEKIDVALLNSGGHFGMETEQVVQAAVALHPRWVIPHHFQTFPVLTQNTRSLFQLLEKKQIPHREMKPGETLRFVGRQLQSR